MVVMLVGFIGACTASTGCSIKVFRFLVLFEAIKLRMRQLGSPHQVIALRLGGKRLEEDVVSSVIVMFTAFALAFVLLATGLALTGLDTRTALTAAWTAICNVGPAYGPEVGPTGAVDQFSTVAEMADDPGHVPGAAGTAGRAGPVDARVSGEDGYMKPFLVIQLRPEAHVADDEFGAILRRADLAESDDTPHPAGA